MWRKPENREQMLREAIEFTGDHVAYGRAMRRVIKEWPISCEHNLSNLTQNRKAWIGHAACALERGMCEDVVRAAWSQLTDEQRRLANEQAQKAIEVWESCQSEDWESTCTALLFKGLNGLLNHLSASTCLSVRARILP